MNVERKTNCSEGKRNCGTELDPICIVTSQGCPITSILYLPKAQYESDYRTKGYTAVDFDENNVIASSTVEPGQPISDVRIEMERPCQDMFA